MKMDESLECSKRRRTPESDIPSQIHCKKSKLDLTVEQECNNTAALLPNCSDAGSAENSWQKLIKAKEDVHDVAEKGEGHKQEKEVFVTCADTTANNECTTTGILSLSDDILLILLSYLNSTDLFNLSKCNVRLYNVCADRSLWNKVYAVCDGCTPSHSEQSEYFHSATWHLQFTNSKPRAGVPNNLNEHGRQDVCFGVGVGCVEEFFETFSQKVPNLRTLIIENHTLSLNSFMLKFLPESITELRLPGLNLLDLNQDTFFIQNICTFLPHLEIFDVSYCQWFSAHALLPLGKCTNLKELKMTGCRKLNDFIPYASIATTFGFKGLQKLDMRLTDLVDREIACFNKTKSLKHIYLEKPPPDAENSNLDESVTDICTTSFGMRNCQTDQSSNTVYITRVPVDGGPYVDYTLETLVVRNYPGITDITLKHAQKCLKSLKYLDVTGSSCTAAQACVFKLNRPEVTLIFNEVV